MDSGIGISFINLSFIFSDVCRPVRYRCCCFLRHASETKFNCHSLIVESVLNLRRAAKASEENCLRYCFFFFLLITGVCLHLHVCLLECIDCRQLYMSKTHTGAWPPWRATGLSSSEIKSDSNPNHENDLCLNQVTFLDLLLLLLASWSQARQRVGWHY